MDELKREPVACLRQAHNKRTPRSKGQDRRGQIPEMLQHPRAPARGQRPEVPRALGGRPDQGRGNASVVGSLVERTSRLLMLVKLPHPKPASAASVMQAFTDKLRSITQPKRNTPTYDQGRELARYKELTAHTGVAMCFCDPRSPWQRGSNENIIELVRQYLPKGMDLSGYSQERLDAIATESTTGPRKGLGVRISLAVYRQLLITHSAPQSNTIH